jgi:hypothetical protein
VALLDGVSDQLCGTGLSLSAHDNGLFLLSRFIDDEGGALGFLLRYLFCFDGRGEFGGEGEMLPGRLARIKGWWVTNILRLAIHHPAGY